MPPGSLPIDLYSTTVDTFSLSGRARLFRKGGSLCFTVGGVVVGESGGGGGGDGDGDCGDGGVGIAVAAVDSGAVAV